MAASVVPGDMILTATIAGRESFDMHREDIGRRAEVRLGRFETVLATDADTTDSRTIYIDVSGGARGIDGDRRVMAKRVLTLGPLDFYADVIATAAARAAEVRAL